MASNNKKETEWTEVKKKCRLNEETVRMAKETGLNKFYKKLFQLRKNKENTMISTHIIDKPKNIVERLTFYNKESRLLEKKLNEKEKRLYLKEIKKDITFYKKFNNRADYEFNIENIKLEEIPKMLIEFLKQFEI